MGLSDVFDPEHHFLARIGSHLEAHLWEPVYHVSRCQDARFQTKLWFLRVGLLSWSCMAHFSVEQQRQQCRLKLCHVLRACAQEAMSVSHSLVGCSQAMPGVMHGPQMPPVKQPILQRRGFDCTVYGRCLWQATSSLLHETQTN